MEKRTILITGTTHGLGKQMSYLLAKNNRLILLGRNSTLLQKQQIELIELSDNQSIDYVVCDYIDKASVYNASTYIHNKYQVIDVIIHNAGALLKPDGSKVHPALKVNFLSPMLLNELLLDLLQKSSNPLLFYTSTMATPKEISDHIIKNMSNTSKIKSYSLAKLSFSLYLNTISNKQITIKIFDPKIVYTNAVKTMIPKPIRWISPLALIFSRTPKKVALKAIKVLDMKNKDQIDYYVYSKRVSNKKIERHLSKKNEIVIYAKEMIQND